MIDAEDFCAALESAGYAGATGVPCSYFNGPIAVLSAGAGTYVGAVNEGSAIGIAAGAYLTGKRLYVMLQNSGLGNVINPLTSLLIPYKIPVLSFVSLRGFPNPADDEPQHEVMGRSTHGILDAVGVMHLTLGKGAGRQELESIIDRLEPELEAGRPAFVLVEKGVVSDLPRTGSLPPRSAESSREVMAVIAEATRGRAVVTSTGFTSRDLFTVDDRPSNFYMQGSMGHASAIALGVALSNPARTVIVVDGDGSALMHLGSMSTVGHYAPQNLVHIVMDNGVHDSTGAQATSSSTTSFDAIAVAAGYRSATVCLNLDALREELSRMLGTAGPHLCVVPTLPRLSAEIPRRVTDAHRADAITRRFMDAYLQTGGISV